MKMRCVENVARKAYLERLIQMPACRILLSFVLYASGRVVVQWIAVLDNVLRNPWARIEASGEVGPRSAGRR